MLPVAGRLRELTAHQRSATFSSSRLNLSIHFLKLVVELCNIWYKNGAKLDYSNSAISILVSACLGVQAPRLAAQDRWSRHRSTGFERSCR